MKNGSLYFKTADGTHLFVSVAGRGRPLLLCHPWGASSLAWRKNVAALAERFCVLTWDLRGHGRSQKNLVGHSLQQAAHDLNELIVTFGLQDIVLAGCGLGASVTLAWWETFAQKGRATKLLLGEVNPFPFSDKAWNPHPLGHFNTDGVNKMRQRLIDDRQSFWQERHQRDRYRPGNESCESDLNDYLTVAPWAAAALYEDFLYRDFTSLLPQIRVPTLILGADEKSGTGAANRYVASRIPRSDCRLFSETGRRFYEEKADEVNPAIISFGKK